MCNSPESSRNPDQQNRVPLDLPIPLDLPHIDTKRNRGSRTSNDIPLDLTARNNNFGDLDNLGE